MLTPNLACRFLNTLPYFATVCPEAEIYTIEKNEQMLQAARHNIAESGLQDRIHSLFGDGQEQIEKLASQGINGFDFVFIDCPPSLGVITTNALTASDSIIIPVQCEFFALEGIMQLLNSIMIAQKKLNPTLDIEGVLLTMLDYRTNLGLEVVEEIKSYFKDKVYDTIIPRLVRLSEAPSHGKPIHAYDSKSRGTEAYINLAKEVIARNGE